MSGFENEVLFDAPGKTKIRFRPPQAVVKAHKHVDKTLQKKGKSVGEMEIAHKKISIFLDTWVQRNFQSSGDKVGGWAPLKHRVGKPLILTGRLRQSFSSFWSRLDAGIGSNIKYAPFHNEGTARLPQRRILPQDDDVRQDVRRLYDVHISKAIKK